MSLQPHESPRPPEPPPKAFRSTGINWVRQKLFNTVFNGTLTVLVVVGLLAGIPAVLGFLFSPDRRWEVIPPNAANYVVGSYPRDDLGNMWLSLWIVAALTGLSTVLWGMKGRVSVLSILAGVRAAGVTAVVVGVLSLWSPAGSTFRSLLIWGGVGLAAAGWAVGRSVRDDRTVSTPSALAALLVVGMAAIWLVWPGTAGEWRARLLVVAVLLIGFHWVGRLAGRWASERAYKRGVTVLWVLSFPFIYLHVQRNPSLAWEEVTPWLPWAGLVVAAGTVVIGLVSRLGREQAAAVNFLLGGLAIGSWVVQWPMAIRILMLVLTLFSLATPTFAKSPQSRRIFYWSWLGGSACLLYFFLLGVGSTDLGTRGEFLGGLNLTLMLAVGGIALSIPVGVFLALGRTSTMPVFRLMSTAYIEVVRGVPLITVLFFADKVIPRFLPQGLDFAGEAKALLAIAAFSAAYLAENVRGGLQSVSGGQFEAARSLGMTSAQMTMLITLPQALRAVIPAMVGQAIALFKDTSLVAIIGLADFLRVARDVVPNQPDSLGSVLENLLLAAVVYWIFAFSFSRTSQRLEKRLGVGTR